MKMSMNAYQFMGVTNVTKEQIANVKTLLDLLNVFVKMALFQLALTRVIQIVVPRACVFF